jgi:hypothetical protein
LLNFFHPSFSSVLYFPTLSVFSCSLFSSSIFSPAVLIREFFCKLLPLLSLSILSSL